MGQRFIFLFMIGMIVLCFSWGAFAQVQGDHPPGPADTVAQILEPYVQMVVSAAVLALLTYVTNLVRRWTGIKIENSQRDALHSALMTGVANELAVRGKKAGKILLEEQGNVVNAAVAYAQKSVPDALKALGPSKQILQDIAASKITLLAERATGAPVSGEPGRS